LTPRSNTGKPVSAATIRLSRVASLARPFERTPFTVFGSVRLGDVTAYFLRHGIAERNDASGDFARKLTGEGRAALQRLAQVASFQPSVILSSPYVRAVETAELLAHESGWRTPVLTSDALTPNSSAEGMWAEIRVHQEDSILVVAHEPLLSSSISWMLGSTRAMVRMLPGTLAALSVESRGAAPVAELLWMITPSMLR
jgi:phosphohistidine phosphatase